MAKYLYPAVFTKEEKGNYSINFPDIQGCNTCGDDVEDGYKMAEDVLALMLTHMEDNKEVIAPPSAINDLAIDQDSFATLISCDTTEYRKLYGSKAVKKTLSIPEWLNTAALEANINFSQVLQEALKVKLGV